MCKEIWWLPSQWPSVERFIVVETRPKRVGRDLENLKSKIRKRVEWHRSKGVCLGELSRWSKWLKSHNKRRPRVVRAMVERRPRGEVTSGYNATIVVATISCEIARNGRRLRRRFAPAWETRCFGPIRPYRRVTGMEPLDH